MKVKQKPVKNKSVKTEVNIGPKGGRFNLIKNKQNNVVKRYIKNKVKPILFTADDTFTK